jgi:hypothetical protein
MEEKMIQDIGIVEAVIFKVPSYIEKNAWRRIVNLISELEAELTHYKDAFKVVEAEMLELKAQVAGKDNKIWHKGHPDHVYGSEWFIAITSYGGKVVLIELPKEHSYDYRTKDDTYIMKDRIKKWMQFPNSEFTPYCTTAKNCPLVGKTLEGE